MFKGETLSDTLAAVLTHEPDWTLLPPFDAARRTPAARAVPGA